MVILEILKLTGSAVLLYSTFNPLAILLSIVILAVILIWFFADSHDREAFNLG